MSKTMYNGEGGEDKSLLTNQPGEKREGLPLHRQEREMGRKPGAGPPVPVGAPAPLLHVHTHPDPVHLRP